MSLFNTPLQDAMYPFAEDRFATSGLIALRLFTDAMSQRGCARYVYLPWSFDYLSLRAAFALWSSWLPISCAPTLTPNEGLPNTHVTFGSPNAVFRSTIYRSQMPTLYADQQARNRHAHNQHVRSQNAWNQDPSQAYSLPSIQGYGYTNHKRYVRSSNCFPKDMRRSVRKCLRLASTSN
ncbi:hypothetical protein CC80DRAFT_79902 [Byssothecium circinans]|uniref:Uncharacterized protein n=1 Tax=Byssothecium circinans TaxID=147558 RepID=A0A6A5TW18_9PLEO|nr:hypothetical protein CC80DRAFT_79902 [Byssothecium circinans]